MATKHASSKFGTGRNGELLKAMAHPLKQRILVALDETQASPSELATRLDEDFQTVARLVRELRSVDPPLIEKVGETKVRGGTAHIYKTVGRPVLDLGPWEKMPQLLREIQSTQAGQILLGDLAEAIKAGTFDALVERTMLRDTGGFDREGAAEFGTAALALLDTAAEIEARSAGRMLESDEEPIRMSISILGFEMPQGRPTE